jgi:hypothetical protein
MQIRVTLPRSAAAYRKGDASEPIIANAANCEEEASLSARGSEIAADADEMAAEHSVGGELTASATIDLTAAPDARYSTITRDCSTLYPTFLEFKAPTDNAAAVTIATHGTDGYPVPGYSLPPGGRLLVDFRPDDDGVAPSPRPQVVDATHHQIAITITGGDSLLWNGAFGA